MAGVDNETIDSYLIQMDMPAQVLKEGIWLVEDRNDDTPPVIISHEPPIVYVRLKVMELPDGDREALYRRLLEYNATGVAYGAYAVEDNHVLLIDTLRSDTMDLDELRASIESMLLAVHEHYHDLAGLATAAS